jgi:Fe-S-cluster containining protein
MNKAIKKYTVPDPDKPGALDFKHILPCKFYDASARGCKIYPARPWSCRIFPFLGVYGSEDQVKVHESCPGSVETMKILTAALEEARHDPALSASARMRSGRQRVAEESPERGSEYRQSIVTYKKDSINTLNLALAEKIGVKV